MDKLALVDDMTLKGKTGERLILRTPIKVVFREYSFSDFEQGFTLLLNTIRTYKGYNPALNMSKILFGELEEDNDFTLMNIRNEFTDQKELCHDKWIYVYRKNEKNKLILAKEMKVSVKNGEQFYEQVSWGKEKYKGTG